MESRQGCQCFVDHWERLLTGVVILRRNFIADQQRYERRFPGCGRAYEDNDGVILTVC